jgi:hypothetical protein
MAVPNRVNFNSRDFDTYFDDLSKRLKDEYGTVYNDFSSSSFGMMLVDLFAYTADQLGWYTDRRASESFLDTALHRDSVARLTRQIGYAMRPAASATADLDVSPETAQTFEFTIATGFQFKGPNNLTFEVTQDVTWPANDATTRVVPVREGATKRVTVSSTGLANQEISLAAANGEGKYLVQDSVRVFVDGAEWTELEFLQYEMSDTFEVHYLTEPPVVRFGNGVAGNIPPTGAEIRIIFVVGSGILGNISSGSIVSTVRPLVARFTPIPLTITNPDPSSGGAAPEDIESAKVNAPKYFASRGVAVTESDYRILASTFQDPQYGRVAKATAYCARTITGDALANNLLNDLSSQIEAYQSEIQTSSDQLEIDLDAIQTQIDTAQTQALVTDGYLLDIDSQASAINSATLAVQGKMNVLQDIIDISEDILNDDTTGYLTTLAEVVTILSAEGYAAQALSIAAFQADLTSASANLTTAKSDIESSIASARAANQSIQADVDFAQLAQATQSSALVSAETSVTSANTQQATIDAAVASHEIAINADIDSMVAHLDTVVAADCKANIITVPILAKDGDGFYVAPTTGLVRRLQEYLQSVADVAHSVSVASGEDSLVEAAITLQVKRSDAYTYQEVASDAYAAVKAMLKSRNYGVSLYLFQIHSELNAVPGLELANVTIDGDIDFVDSNGNLIVDKEHVITFGSITVEELIT